ncbi:MAG: dTDP-4-dehydrorhamnose reductase [Pyrinomonadaceae bacterium]
MKILVTGAAGMVGRTLCDLCRSAGDTVLPFDHSALDISNADGVLTTIAETNPDAVINCAAWTDVDACEADAERAFAANARGPENLAVGCSRNNSVFVTISTDYVFDGTKKGFYIETDEPNPISVYGRSKLEGECLVQQAFRGAIVVRSGFIFGRGGKNFLSTVHERIRDNGKIKAIADAYGTPTYAKDLAARLYELVRLKRPGVYHVANSGDGGSYEEFVSEVVRITRCSKVEVERVASDSLNRPAPRPHNSRLRSLYLESVGLLPLPDWRDSLAEFIRERSDAGE